LAREKGRYVRRACPSSKKHFSSPNGKEKKGFKKGEAGRKEQEAEKLKGDVNSQLMQKRGVVTTGTSHTGEKI